MQTLKTFATSLALLSIVMTSLAEPAHANRLCEYLNQLKWWPRIFRKTTPARENELPPETLDVKVVIKQAPPKPVIVAEPKTLADVKNLLKGWNEQILIESLQSDTFYRSSPFGYRTELQPITKILTRGVKSVKRTTFRSLENQRAWNSSYDVVYYQIEHNDSTRSSILAYKRADNGFQSMLGAGDFRPTYLVYEVAENDGQMSEYIYKDGKLDGVVGTGTQEEGLAITQKFVDEALEKNHLKLIGNKEIEITKPHPVAEGELPADINIPTTESVTKYNTSRIPAKSLKNISTSSTKFGIEFDGSKVRTVDDAVFAYLKKSGENGPNALASEVQKLVRYEKDFAAKLEALRTNLNKAAKSKIGSVENARLLGFPENDEAFSLRIDNDSGAIIATYRSGTETGQTLGYYNLPNISTLDAPVSLPNQRGYAVLIQNDPKKFYVFANLAEAQSYVLNGPLSFEQKLKALVHETMDSGVLYGGGDIVSSTIVHAPKPKDPFNHESLDDFLGENRVFVVEQYRFLRMSSVDAMGTNYPKTEGLYILNSTKPGTLLIVGRSDSLSDPHQFVEAATRKHFKIENVKILREKGSITKKTSTGSDYEENVPMIFTAEIPVDQHPTAVSASDIVMHGQTLLKPFEIGLQMLGISKDTGTGSIYLYFQKGYRFESRTQRYTSRWNKGDTIDYSDLRDALDAASRDAGFWLDSHYSEVPKYLTRTEDGFVITLPAEVTAEQREIFEKRYVYWISKFSKPKQNREEIYRWLSSYRTYGIPDAVAESAEYSGFADRADVVAAMDLGKMEGGIIGHGTGDPSYPSLREQKGFYTVLTEPYFWSASWHWTLGTGDKTILEAVKHAMVPYKTEKGAWVVFINHSPQDVFKPNQNTLAIFATEERAIEWVRTHKFVLEGR